MMEFDTIVGAKNVIEIAIGQSRFGTRNARDQLLGFAEIIGLGP